MADLLAALELKGLGLLHVVGREAPERALALVVVAARLLDEALVQRQVVPDRVLRNRED